MKDVISIKRDGKEFDITRVIYESLIQCLGQMDKVLPQEVLNSTECPQLFYNAAMQLYITLGKSILNLPKEKLVEHLKIVLDSTDGTIQNKEAN